MIEKIDLRSDTVTKPSPGMLKAMLHAEVGDDVFGEDPTINALQERAAKMFGQEAGLFCPSGTMTNQIAIQVHTRPGDEVICHEQSHVYNYEGGGIGRNAFSSAKLVRNNRSVMAPDEVDALVNADHDWLARTSLVVAEDTSNRGGGKCYTFDELEQLSKYCRSKELGFHMDGARVFNAIVQQGHESVRYGLLFDSISVCLSKGLGAPVGSVLLGSKPFIKEAKRVRKVMGGGMRQAGILAAAGMYALDHNVERLAEDHKRAAALAEVIKGLGKVKFVIPPETNILIFDVDPAIGETRILEELELSGLRGVAFGKNRIRLVTHLNIGDKELAMALKILRKVLS
jgi:threonine aldolase